MLRHLVSSSLRFRLLVVALAFAVVAVGYRRSQDLPVDVFPEFAPPLIEIQTEAPGFSVEEIDEFVTVPLESSLVGTPGVSTVRSKSVLGLSSIVLILEGGADVLGSRQAVQERLATAVNFLPTSVRTPVMLAPLSALSRVMKVGISSKKLSMLELSDLIRWTVRPRLMSVPGVVNVAVWGQRDRELQIKIDPESLEANELTLDQLIETGRSASSVGAGGFIDTPNQRLSIVANLAAKTAAELARAPIESSQRPLRLGDVAEVVEGEAPLIGEGVIDGGLGLLLIVEKQPGANTLEVTRGVESALSALAPALTDVKVDPTIFRPATFIEMSVENLKHSLIIGIILVALVLAFFLFDWRTALISMTALPISLFVAVLVLDVLGHGINTMVLAGLIISLGEVVDDAIIDVENISRRLRLNKDSGQSVFRIILDASLEVRGAVGYGTMVIILVMIPVFFLEGLAGSFFRPLAWAYVLAILASLLTAVTLTPALSMMILSKRRGAGKTPPLIRVAIAIYRPVLNVVLKVPKIVVMIAVIILLSAGTLFTGFGEDFMPRFKEYDFLMHWVEKPGIGIDASRRITERVGVELMQVPGVRNFGAHIGRAEVADEVVGPDFTELWISIDPKADYDDTIKRVAEVIDGYPGLYRDLLTYLKERIKEVLTGTSASIVVRIHGSDLAVLREQADEVAKKLKSVEGLINLKVEHQVLVPRLQIDLKPDSIESFGLAPSRVRKTLNTFVNGNIVGEIFEGQRMYRVVVRGNPEKVQDPEAIARLPIDLPGGGYVPLGDVAHIAFAPSPNVIKRDGGSRRIDVVGNVEGRDLASVATEVENTVMTHSFPRGYHPEFLGEYKAQKEARTQLLSLCALSILGILVLLQTNFKSLRATLIVFLALPFSLAGGVLAVYFSGGVLSLGSFIGFVTVLGVGARNSIMMIDHYRHLELEEGIPFGMELVRRGAEERLAPILMTALTTALALIPIVAAAGKPGTEIEHPMAIVILGGLLSSLILNLLVIPPIYIAFGKGAAQRGDIE